MKPTFLPILTLLLLGLCMVQPRDVRAKSSKATAIAQEYIKMGEKLFRLKSYGDAVASFLKASTTLEKDEIDVPPVLYRSIARCYDQMGQIIAALRNYKKFVALVDESNPKYVRAIRDANEATERLQSLLDRTAIQFEVQPDGVQVRIDQRVVGLTPLPLQKVRPGPHQITFHKDGYEPQSTDVSVAPGGTAPVLVNLKQHSAAIEEKEAPVGGLTHPFIVAGLAATGAAAGVAALIYALDGSRIQAGGDEAQQKIDSLIASNSGVPESCRPPFSQPCERYRDLQQAQQQSYDEAAGPFTTALILGTAGSLALITATTLFILGREEAPPPETGTESSATKASLQPVVGIGPSGVLGGVLLHF